jgi:hypothetical protein
MFISLRHHPSVSFYPSSYFKTSISFASVVLPTFVVYFLFIQQLFFTYLFYFFLRMVTPIDYVNTNLHVFSPQK